MINRCKTSWVYLLCFLFIMASVFSDSVKAQSVVKRPILGAVYNNENETLYLNIFRHGENQPQWTKFRFRDSLGWSDWQEEIHLTLCGDLMVGIFPRVPASEFTVQLESQVGDQTYDWYYYGMIGNNEVVYGKWTVTGDGKIGFIQNHTGSDSYLPEDLPGPFPISYNFFDAVSVFGTLDATVQINHSYQGTLYGQPIDYYQYENCSLDSFSQLTYDSGFNLALGVDGLYFLLGASDPPAIPNLTASFSSIEQISGGVKMCLEFKNDGTENVATGQLFQSSLFLNSQDQPPIFASPEIVGLSYALGLTSGESYTWCVDREIAPGNYQAYLWVDKYDHIYEANENDNLITDSFELVGPSITPEPGCENGDIDKNGTIDSTDFKSLMSHWGEMTATCEDCPCDQDGDDKTNGIDLGFALLNWSNPSVPTETPTPTPTCTGCLQGASCLPGTANIACGEDGAICIDCSSTGEVCVSHVCVSAGPTPTPEEFFVVLNSATNASCDEICQEAEVGSSCSSIGIDSGATNGQIYLWPFVGSNCTISSSNNTCQSLVECCSAQCFDANGPHGPVLNWTNCRCLHAPAGPSPTPTPIALIMENSATGESCNQICQESGKTCLSVGTNPKADNNKRMLLFSGNCQNYNSDCQIIMDSREATCCNRQTSWTNCRCVQP